MQAVNPYLPSWEYVPDGEPRLFGDRVYVYGSHDAFDGADFCVNDYVCWSAPADNLADWRYEGVIYRKNQDPKNPDGKKQKCCRQGCAEKLMILKDGSIPQVEMTSCGLNDGPLAGTGTYEARIACNLYSAQGTFAYLKTREKDKKKLHPYFTQSGTDREDNPDQYIANMKDGATAGFKYFDFKKLKQVSVTVRGTGSGRMEVRTASSGAVIASIAIKPSASWTTFHGAVTGDISGTQALYFTYKGDGALDFQALTLS